MKKFTIISFYIFAPVTNLELMKKSLLEIMKDNNITGTIILASEGANGSFCGEPSSVLILTNALKAYEELKNINFFETYNDINPFKKSKVKLRKEIVTLGVATINPVEETGIHLEPAQWNELMDTPEVICIDTRNDYEVKLGTFDGAINPQTDNFRDFPEYVQHHLADKKEQPIAMFCTGGIRCEKSTAYLKQLGFKHVYQLKGGILNYLNVIPEEQSKWQGSCFVFDERVALDGKLNSLEEGSIDKEWKNNNKIKRD